MTDDPDLIARLKAAPPLPEPPPELRERTLRAMAAAAEIDGAPARPARRARPWWRIALVPIGAAVLLVFLLTRPQGELELRADLRDGDTVAQVEVREIGEGRTVRVDTDDLPVLPKGEYYEVWFVGPQDAPGRPQRVSAGTFHPDPQGRTHVTLFGAVDPAKLPEIEITAEPGDGDPAPSGTVVLRGS